MKIASPIKKQLFVSREVSEDDTKKHFNTHGSRYSQTWFISSQINLNLLEGKSEFPFLISYFLTRHTAPLTYSTSFTFCIQQSVKLNLICSQTPHEIKLSLSQGSEYKIEIGHGRRQRGWRNSAGHFRWDSRQFHMRVYPEPVVNFFLNITVKI